LVWGPGTEIPPTENINLVKVQTAQEMFEACLQAFPHQDLAILSAAVADYTPQQTSNQKIKKTDIDLSLNLVRTPDILQTLGTMKKNGQCLVGFALETENERKNAMLKLEQKNADFIVLNSLNDSGAGFGSNTNKISIFDRSKNEWHFDTKSKQAVAEDILNVVVSGV
jgi:phosphopantothenoylcysteine decarboxylase/phosphopantothenate--cysteine ligase